MKIKKYQKPSGPLPKKSFWWNLANQLSTAPSNGETTIAAHNADLNRQVEQARKEAKSKGQNPDRAEEEVYKRGLRTNGAIVTGAALGALATTVPAVAETVKFATRTPVGRKALQKVMKDTAISMAGGTGVDLISDKMTGMSFGRYVAGAVPGARDLYDNSGIARFGMDLLNPGYLGLSGSKALLTGIDNTVNNTVEHIAPIQIKRIQKNLANTFGKESEITTAGKTPIKWKHAWSDNPQYQNNVITSRLWTDPSVTAHEFGHHVSANYPGLQKGNIMGAHTPGYVYGINTTPEREAAENFADVFRTRAGWSYKGKDPSHIARQRAVTNNLGETQYYDVVDPGAMNASNIPESAWAEMLNEEAIAEAGALRSGTLGSSKFRPTPSRPITEAEKLGIPKGLRSNPKALEDPQYWGYKQWNDRYNAAIESGNIEEVQRLRDLHFITKAKNNALVENGHLINLYHGNVNSKARIRSAGRDPYDTRRTSVGSSGYFAVDNPEIAKTYIGPKGYMSELYGYTRNPMIHDAKGSNWDMAGIQIGPNGERFGMTTDRFVNKQFTNGHDAVIIKNVTDYGPFTLTSTRAPFTDYVFKPGHVKLRDPVIWNALHTEPIPIVKRDNFSNPDIRYGFSFNDDLPPAKWTYNPKVGNFEVDAPKKEWIEKGEELVADYFWTPEEYDRLIKSGASPELANEIQGVRWVNTLNRKPSVFRNFGKWKFGESENIDGQIRIKYNSRKGQKASLEDPNTTLQTIFHELGGHGSSLNIGAGSQTIPEGQAPILTKILKHNESLHPKLRPFYQAVKDGDFELAVQLSKDINTEDLPKAINGNLNWKEIQNFIKYMEDTQEYSARAIGSNMSDHYGLYRGWNENQLRQYFTDESVDNLKKNVWLLGLPILGGAVAIEQNKKPNSK